MAQHRTGTAPARRRVHRPALVAALAVCAALSGCATGSPEPGESTTVTSRSATSTPTAPATSSPSPTAGAGAVSGPNSIGSPVEGTEVTSPVTATGEGTAFEGTLLYRVVAAGTSDVALEGFTTAGANGEVGPWELVLELEPGTWTLELWEPDVSDGEGSEGGEEDGGSTDPRRHLVAVTFTVR